MRKKKIDEKICERQNNLQEIRLKKKTQAAEITMCCAFFSLSVIQRIQFRHRTLCTCYLSFDLLLPTENSNDRAVVFFRFQKMLFDTQKKKTLAWMKWVNEARQQCASTSETTQSSSHFVYNFTVKRVIVKTERWVKSPCRWLLRFLFLAIDHLSLSLFVHSKTFS